MEELRHLSGEKYYFRILQTTKKLTRKQLRQQHQQLFLGYKQLKNCNKRHLISSKRAVV